MTFNIDPAAALEKAIASKLSPLEDWRVRLFADDPERSNRASGANTVYIGHNVTNFERIDEDNAIIVFRETATFLFQITSTDLRSHHKCMEYMGKAINEIARYKPFSAIDPFIPVRYGDPRLLEEDGLWLYSGTVTATWNNLPREQILEPPKVVIANSIIFGAYLGPSGQLFRRSTVEVEYADET